MININAGTLIYRPIKRVFEFISMSENDFQWQYGTLASAQLADGQAKVGTAFRSVGHLLGQRTQSTYEVTEYVPNSKYGFRSLSGPLNSSTAYTFNIARGSTQVELSLQATVINLLEFSENILEKKLKKQVKENLAMLKSILEAE